MQKINAEEEYQQGVRCMGTKSYEDAKAHFLKAISVIKEGEEKKDDVFGGIAYGGLGYCCYKQKNSYYYDSKRYFENKNFLLGSTHRDFMKYVLIWATLYYNMSKWNEFENILFCLQNYNRYSISDKKYQEVPEGETFLRDYKGQFFKNDHIIIKFIKGLIFWKKKGCLEKAKEYLTPTSSFGSKTFIDLIQKEIDDKVKKIEIKKNELNNLGNNPNNIDKYVELLYENARLNYECGTSKSLNLAEKQFKELLEKDINQKMKKSEYYIYLGKIYAKLSKHVESKDAFLEAIGLNNGAQDDDSKLEQVKIYLDIIKTFIFLKVDLTAYKELIQGWLSNAEEICSYFSEISLVKADYLFYTKNYAAAFQEYNRYKAINMAENALLDSKIFVSQKIMDIGEIVLHNDTKPQLDAPVPDTQTLKFQNSMEIANIPKDANQITLSDQNKKVRVKKMVKSCQELKATLNKSYSELFLFYTLNQNILVYDSYQSTLFEYLHNESYPENKDKVFDQMPYVVKIKIIKQINNILKTFIKKDGKDLYLTPFNLVITEMKEEVIKGSKIQYPIIKLNLLETELIPFKSKDQLTNNLFNWNHYRDFIDIIDFDITEAQPTKNYFYSFSVLIWEIITRKIPFHHKLNTKTAMNLVKSLRENSLLYKDLPYDIPLPLYDFFYRFLKLQKEIYREEEMDQFFAEIEKIPEEEIDLDLPNFRRPKKYQLFKDDPNYFVSRFKNWKYFDFDREFVQGIGKISKTPPSCAGLVHYYGPAINGYDFDNWYFYTEKLENSLAEKLNEGVLSDEEKMKYLLIICETVNNTIGSKGHYINFLDERWIFECEEEFGRNSVKILNHGDDFHFLETMFPNNKGRVYAKKQEIDINILRVNLCDDFLILVFRMFKNYFVGNNDKEIKENLEKIALDDYYPDQNTLKYYKFLYQCFRIYRGEVVRDSNQVYDIEYMNILIKSVIEN